MWNPESKSALDFLIWGDTERAYIYDIVTCQWVSGEAVGGGGVVQPMSTFDTTLLKHQKSSQPLEKGLLFPQVNGFDVTDVPQQMFFDLLRAAEKVAKIQILKIPVSKV